MVMKKQTIIALGVVVMLIAGILDIKYKGLFYQMVHRLFN